MLFDSNDTRADGMSGASLAVSDGIREDSPRDAQVVMDSHNHFSAEK